MNAIFVGEKRSGKTTLAFDIAKKSGGGIIVFDPKKEFRDWPATVSTVMELEAAIQNKHEIIIYRPASDEDVAQSFDALADWILAAHDIALAKGWDKQKKNFTVLIDEAYNLQSHAWINDKLLRILSQCRPEVLNVFQTFQSVKNVNSDSRSRVTDWYLFTITLPTDLKRLEEFAQPEVVEAVQTLDEHEYVHFINEKGKVASEINHDAESWYTSLDFTPENEREDKAMARDDDERGESLRDLFNDFLDFLDDSGYEVTKRRKNRDDDRGGDRSERRERRPRSSYEEYQRRRAS